MMPLDGPMPNIQDKIIQISTTSVGHSDDFTGMVFGLSKHGYLYELKHDKSGSHWEFICESPNLFEDKKVEGIQDLD